MHVHIEIRRTPDAPWEPAPSAQCVQVDRERFDVTLPMVAPIPVPVGALDGMPIRVTPNAFTRPNAKHATIDSTIAAIAGSGLLAMLVLAS